MSVDISELRNLPIAEKLRIVELLWDDIGAAGEPVEIHPWQFHKAVQRAKELDTDPSIAIDRDELWRRVNG